MTNKNTSTPVSTSQTIPSRTYLAITIIWCDSNGTHLGDTLNIFRNNQLPYQFSKGDYIKENNSGALFTGYVETIEHNIQRVSHSDEWQHLMTITMKDSTRVD